MLAREMPRVNTIAREVVNRFARDKGLCEMSDGLSETFVMVRYENHLGHGILSGGRD